MPTEGYHLSSLDSVEAHCWAVGTVLYTLLAAVDHLADGAEQGFWARAQRALQACRTTLWAEAFGSVAAVLSLVPYYADKGPLGERLRRLAGGAPPPPPPFPQPHPECRPAAKRGCCGRTQVVGRAGLAVPRNDTAH